jgi:hypothetical protein
MEHVIAGYLRQVWDTIKWFYEGQTGFRPGYLCENQIIKDCKDTVYPLNEGARIEVIIIDFQNLRFSSV